VVRKQTQTRDDQRAIGYARVSTVQQAQEGYSLDAQREKIATYCSMRDLELVDVFSDEGVSASIPFAHRPGGTLAAETLSSHGAGHLVGLKIDRFFRNTVDCLSSISVWDDSGVALHLVDMGGQAIDTSTAMGRFFLTMMAGMAEWERNVISERTIMALQQKKAKGDDLGAAAFGQRWNTTTHKLEENLEEVFVIRRIRTLRRSGLSYAKIAKLLNDNGVPARHGKWHVNTIVRILKRPRGK